MIKSRRVLKNFKGLCIVYTAIFVASIFLLNFSLFSYADGNWTDTLYEYTNSYWGVQITDAPTERREKWDDSSSYAYNDASNTDIMQVRVYGAFATGQPEDCTYGTPKSLPRGAAYYLPNLVYEYGEGIYSHKPDYTHAFLMFHPVNGLQGMYLHIWWSPDSI